MKREPHEENTLTRAASAAFSALKAYVWPETWRQAGASLCAAYFIAMPSARLLPTAEEYFKSEGLDPAAIAQLTDRPVHVARHDLKSAFHTAMQMPHIFLQASTLLAALTRPESAYSWPAHRLDPYALLDGKAYFLVQPPALKDISAEKAVSLYTGLPENLIEKAGITPENLEKFILLREIRRSATANEKAGESKNAVADADEAALRAMGPEILRNPAIVKAVVNFRALGQFIKNRNGNPVHNPALYLDAAFRGAPLPSATEADDAARALYKALKTHLRETDRRPDFIRYTEAFRTILAEDETLSPLARRAAELFVEAVEYHAPAAVGGQTRPQTAYSLSGNDAPAGPKLPKMGTTNTAARHGVSTISFH